MGLYRMLRLLPLKILLIIAETVFFVLSEDPCTSPVTFNSTDFTIRGPCPNDTVLAPVGSTVHYRCDYEDRKDGNNLPYWHIHGLTGTPFLDNEGSEHDISVGTAIGGGVAFADLTVTVKEQYLNNTLTIQCGVCITGVCYSMNILSDNITSTGTTLVAFDAPRNLSSTVSEQSDGAVTLYWSTPLVSTDYASIKTVEFEYSVNLFDTANSTYLQTFNTTANQLTLSRINITISSLKCREYSWSVAARASMGAISRHVSESNKSFILQNEPTIIGDPSFKIKHCNNVFEMIVQLNVTTFQPLDTLEYIVWLYDSTELWVLTNENMTINFTTNIVVLELSPPIEHIDINAEGSFNVSVSNTCGNDESEEYQFNFINNVTKCEVFSSQVLPTSSFLHTNSLSTGDLGNPSITATVSNQGVMGDSQSILAVAIVSVACGLIFFLLILFTILIVIVGKKKGRSKSIDIKNDDINSLERNKINLAQSANGQPNVTDYLTPAEAIEAKQEFKANTSTGQYCEPEKLRSQHASQFQESGTCHPDHQHNNVSTFVEMPGYSKPIASKKRRTMKSTNNEISTNNNHNNSEETQHPQQQQQQLQGEDKSMYVDVAEIKANKESKHHIPYATLDLQTTDTGSSDLSLPPKLPSSIYSTIKDC